MMKVRKINRLQRIYLSLLDDRGYAQKKYLWKFGREANLDEPRYFSEKMQWLKLYDDNWGHAIFADKYEVRNIVADRIGKEYLNELYFVTDDPGNIDFETLPDSFVLKATHGSGFNIVCREKKDFDQNTAIRKMRRWLSTNYAQRSRERQYEDIPRRIICERYLEDESGSLRDFKVLCFGGEPRLIWVDVDRYSGHKRSFFSTDWAPVPVTFSKYPSFEGFIGKPENLGEMIALSRELSRGFAFSRIDFYSIGGKTIFGEITFHPASGFAEFAPEAFSLEVGSWIRTDPRGL